MTIYFDDNFGTWDMNDAEDIEFYRHVQATNVLKQCQGCGHWYELQPKYAYCNGCADRIERGGDMPEFVDHPKPGHDDLVDGERDDEDDEPPTPFGSCHACGAMSLEECECDEGATNADGEPFWCYDCNRHYDDCTCNVPDGYGYGYD